MTAKYGLQAFAFDRAPGWAQDDYAPPHSRFACEYDLISDPLKIQHYGFHETIDSEQMFRRILARMRAEKVIP